MSNAFLEELKARGLVFQTTNEEELVKELNKGNVGLYIGFDPTASSLHIGHLVPILILRRFELAGHRPIALMGGGTGLIGDPSFKDAERQLNSLETVQGFVDSIGGQVARFLDFDGKAILENNYTWYKDFLFIDFLRDVGKYFTINYMMSKESVKRRIETGISYTEFAYQLLQGYDFYELNARYGVTLQVGGSDQWGNMTAGTELLRRKGGKDSHVLTVPLITDSNGKKFGKSEGNAVWLDADLTSPYEFYQFWINTPDSDIIKYMKIFSFKTLDELASIESEWAEAPHQRLAQKTLAAEMTELVHGSDALEQALKITEALFSGDIKALNATEIRQGFKDVPSYDVAEADDLNIVEILVASGVVTSKRQAREDVTNGAVRVNGEQIKDVDYVLSDTDKIENEFSVIRRGKKKYHLLKF
ncbi:MAG: tyrosine--tRNA ligase [Lactobacillales bacterium]|nr:tyrosine--tRNA ligase [Lactobacillales bacterium]